MDPDSQWHWNHVTSCDNQGEVIGPIYSPCDNLVKDIYQNWDIKTDLFYTQGSNGPNSLIIQCPRAPKQLSCAHYDRAVAAYGCHCSSFTFDAQFGTNAWQYMPLFHPCIKWTYEQWMLTCESRTHHIFNMPVLVMEFIQLWAICHFAVKKKSEVWGRDIVPITVEQRLFTA